MKVEVVYFKDMWQQIKNAAMTTINKDEGKYPDDEWKRMMLLAEHSPIRLGQFIILMKDIPSFVSTHLVRHKYGIEHFVSTNRDDRNSTKDVPNRITPVNHKIWANYQAIMNISRKRLCGSSHHKTTEVWRMVLDEIEKYDPVLASVCVPECVYRGNCFEVNSCGFETTTRYDSQLLNYIL